ncbi:MAG: MMPL family transporter [Planctomycetaceae bacterium]|jgi:predicted RND superfamily exporter protein|nr:MMPL family transporter [Planctomycetaceae bacterium]
MASPPDHPTETSYFARPLGSLTLLCCRFPTAVLVLSLLLAGLSLYWANEHLGFKMSRLDLINPNSSFNRLWLDYIDEFGDFNEVIVVVEGNENSEVIAALELLTSKIEKFPDRYQDILHGVDLSAVHRKGLHFVPIEDLRTLQQFVAQSLRPGTSAVPMGQATNLLTTLSQSNTAGGDMNYFLFPTEDGVIGLVLLRLIDIDKTKFSQGTESIDMLRNITAEVCSEHTALQIGLTGMPILEHDEMALSNEAMAAATILAFFGVCAIFMAGFGSLRHPLLAVIGLAIAFAWTMGYITLAVGHLNILSVAFGAMLIGLGTDFTVHYLGRYLELRRVGGEVIESLCQAATLVGPGIVVGALTTAAAFYAASFAEFTGVAELGKIVGGGIICCALTTFTVFPAMIVLITPTSPGQGAPSYNLYDIRPAI